MEPMKQWYHRWPWTRTLMFLYCCCCAFVGVLGFSTGPSQAVENQLGYAALMLYSGIMLGSGIIGAVGIFRSLKATVISVWCIAAATGFHGLAVISEGNLQTGVRLLIAPLMMVPMAWAWMQWLILSKNVLTLPWPPRRHHKE